MAQPVPRPEPAAARQRGFTYLWLIFALALGAAGLAAIGQRTGLAVQRERESELRFRGQAIARALASYRDESPGGKVLPLTLQELVEDRRGASARHHLRRLYADPFTGQVDWVLLKTADGRIEGVHSRVDLPAMRTIDLPVPEPGRKALVSDLVFDVADPVVAPIAAPASAPQE